MALLTGTGNTSSLTQLSLPGAGTNNFNFASNPALAGLGGTNGISIAPTTVKSGIDVPATVTPGGIITPQQKASATSLGISVPSYSGTTYKANTQPVSPVTSQPVQGYGTIPASGTPLGAGVADSTYNFLPGETADQYNQRISAYNAERETAGTLAPSDHVGGANPTTLSNGSIVSTNQNGQVTSPTSFSIDTSGTIPSSALSSNYTANDVFNTQNSYANAVQGLAAAQGYSPDYINALQASQAADRKKAELEANFYTGNNLPGDTLDYAQGSTARAEELNSLNQLQAQQALQVQALLRQGNIAAATALAQAYKPEGVSAGSSLVNPVTGQQTFSGIGGYQQVQAIQTVSNLAQTYPDAGILPTDDLATAEKKAQSAPSFASRNLIQVTLPGGGIEFVNKNQLQTNSDGTYTVITPAQGASNEADAASLKTQQSYADNITRALNTADTNFNAVTSLMQKAGINDAGSPIINQLQNKLKLGVVGNGDVAAFYSSIANLRAEYAQVLSKGGAVTDSVRSEADTLIPSDLSLSQLQKVKSQIQLEGNNAVQAANKQVQAIQSRLGGGTTNGSSGSIWSF